jgi:hypothetical protein
LDKGIEWSRFSKAYGHNKSDIDLRLRILDRDNIDLRILFLLKKINKECLIAEISYRKKLKEFLRKEVIILQGYDKFLDDIMDAFRKVNVYRHVVDHFDQFLGNQNRAVTLELENLAQEYKISSHSPFETRSSRNWFISTDNSDLNTLLSE